MKKAKNIKQVLTICCIGLFAKTSFTQFNAPPLPLGSRFGQTDAVGPVANHIRSIGIGNFTNAGAVTNAFLHVNSNYLLLPTNGSITGQGELFRTSGPSTQTNAWRMFTGAGNGTERFNISNLSGTNNIQLGSVQNGTLQVFTNNFTRFLIDNGTGGAANGRAAFGNNLTGFTPIDRLHLYHTTNSAVKMRFSNSTTDVTATDGANLGIENNGDFRLTQFENQNTSIFTPSNLNPANQVERFRVAPNGQVFIGAPGIVNENIILGNPVIGFSDNNDNTALLNVRGPIFSSYPLSATTPRATILYGYSGPENTPTNDGFRMSLDRGFFGGMADALVFEKTDVNQLEPDGGIAFSNRGSNNVEVRSLYIRGSGRTYVGRNIFSSAQLGNRFVIDSEFDGTATGDATKSGLRFVDLISTETPIPNPGAGVLAVDENGNVIYVVGNDLLILELKKNLRS